MATSAPPRINLNDSYGAIFVGVFVCAALWGVCMIQTWYYFNRYPTDIGYIKLLVVATVICDTIHQALITHTLYWYLVTNYANPPALANMVWSINVEVVFNGLIDLFVQGFLTYRVYLLSYKNWYITGILGSAVLGLFGIQIAYAHLALQLLTYQDVHRLKRLSSSINAMGAVLDVIIATCLCYLLQKSRTGYKKTDSKISKIMLFTMNTGLITSVCASLSLITFLTLPNSFVYIAFYFCGGRLYSNSLLASLNTRSPSHGADDDFESMSFSLGPLATKSSRTMNSSNNISIKIDTSKEYSTGSLNNRRKENTSTPLSPLYETSTAASQSDFSPESKNLKVDPDVA